MLFPCTFLPRITKGIQTDENIKFVFFSPENRKFEERQHLCFCQFLNPHTCGSQTRVKRHLSLCSALLGSNFEILINIGGLLGRKGNENMFKQQRLQFSEKLRSVDNEVVAAISNEGNVSIFRVTVPKKTAVLEAEGEGTTFLQNSGNCLPVYMAYHTRRLKSS